MRTLALLCTMNLILLSSCDQETVSVSVHNENSSSSEVVELYSSSSTQTSLTLKGRDCLYEALSNELECIEQTYQTTLIGNQVWLAENLNFDAGERSVCYDHLESNCDKYGRLYYWDAAMQIDENYTIDDWMGGDILHQGVCPNEWHLPSIAEWAELALFVADGDSTLLVEKRGSEWEEPLFVVKFMFSAVIF